MATPDNTQKEGKVVELQEELITKLKELIKVALVNGTSAEDLKSQAEKYIKDFLKEHKNLEGKYTKLYNEWQRVFYSNFNTMYYITKRTADDIFKKQRDKKSEEIYKDLKKAYKDNTKKPNLDKSKESYVFGSNKEIDPQNITAQNAPNLKFIRTSAEYGYTQMQIDDYVEKVERVMDKVANLGFVATNKVGARISLRNKAEMEVRYQDMLSDLEALKEDKFVIVSQHKDASLRCACWQGLIYLKDTDGTDISLKNWHEWNNIKNHITPKPIGTLPNGQPYYSLKDAMEHGLFSYNCRHRFIKYEAGTKVPPQYHYDPNKESEASLIDKKMRQMEEEIRKAKERQNLALTPEERKKWQAKSKALQKKYDEFAKAHNRVRNDWRTSIGRIAERPHMKGIEKGSEEPYISPKKSMKEAGLVRSGIEKNEASEVLNKNSDSDNIKNRELGLLCQHKNIKIEPLDKNEFVKLKSEFEKQGGLFIQDEAAQDYLKYRNADALTLNENTILLKPEPTASEVHEELIHSEQFKKGKLNNITDFKAKLECEIEACKILIKNKDEYLITDEEHNYNLERLKIMEKDYEEGKYDKY